MVSCHVAFCLGGGAGVPVSMPMALMSSSTSGQCTPCPVPIISKCWRCAGVASDNRHDYASGMLIVRPSARWAVISSSMTSTAMIRGSLLAIMVIPCLQNLIQVADNDGPDRIQSVRCTAMIRPQHDRSRPNLHTMGLQRTKTLGTLTIKALAEKTIRA